MISILLSDSFAEVRFQHNIEWPRMSFWFAI